MYAKYDTLKRVQLLNNLNSVEETMTIPMIFGGDFNVIMEIEEIIRGLLV